MIEKHTPNKDRTDDHRAYSQTPQSLRNNN